MIEQEAFNQIDSAIESFKRKEGMHKGIKVSKEPQSGWLVFNYRQLTWSEDGINYLIEVYPSFDTQENITGWNLSASAYYNEGQKRYYTKQTFAENISLDYIATHSEALLLEACQSLSTLNKEHIAFTGDLK